MISRLKKYYFQLQIMLLSVFRPTLLFEKINQLNWYRDMLRQWIDDQSFTTKSKVLEVGCATGVLTAYIAQSGCITTGVDLSSEMIGLAKIKNNDIEYLVANVVDLPFETDVFDVVIATSLINIVADKSKAISELLRTCKKGGMITILVPSDKFSDEDFVALLSSIGSTGFSAAALEAWYKMAPKMSASDITNLFKQTGMMDIKTKVYLQGMVISASAIKPN